MALIKTKEAARRAGVSTRMMRLHLKRAGVPLTRINATTLGVEERDLTAFLAARPSGILGRPGPKPRAIEDFRCECPDPAQHRFDCLRWRAIKRRAAPAQP